MLTSSLSKMHWDKAYVGFTENVDIWWLKPLKKGFKHCFVVLVNCDFCLVIDPLSSHIEVGVYPASILHNFLIFLRANRYKVVETFVRYPTPPTYTIGLFSCVEVVKRVLGIASLSLQTPYKLYLFLQNKK